MDLINGSSNSGDKPRRRVRQLIHLNATHAVGNLPEFRVRFAQALDLRGRNPSIGLASAHFYHSFANIGPEFGNQQFSVTWTDGVTKDFTIPRGYYTAADLSQFVQYSLQQQGWYTPSTTTSSVIHYIRLEPNPTQYTVALTVYAKDGTYPQIAFSPALRKLLGLTQQASYPAPDVSTGTANLVFQSASVPQLSPVSVLTLACNMVSSRLSSNPQAFAQLSINAAWGSLCTYSTGTPTMLSAVPGVFSEFILRTGDQTGESYVLMDKDVALAVVLEWDDDA